MLEGHAPHTGAQPDTQHKGGWTEREKALLEELAPKSPHKNQLLALFPGRTLATIKLHLYAVRRELDLPKRGHTANLQRRIKRTFLDKNDSGIAAKCWQEAQRPRLERANQRFLEALQQQAA